MLGFGRRMLAVLRAERPAIVHGYLPDANLLLAVLRPLLRGARVVWGVRASSVDFSVYDRAARFIDWMRDLGFLQKPGVETKAARDVAAFASQPHISGP